MLRDPDATPSARVLREMREHCGDSYIAFALAKSREHRQAFVEQPIAAEANTRLQQQVEESLARQQTIEACDSVSFEEYRQQYLARDLTSGMRLAS
jgi:glutamate--cysteine ligase